MSPGEVITADEAALVSRCGIVVRPWFGAAVERITGPSSYVVVSAPANALARLGAYRVAVIATWPPMDGEESEAHAIRKANAIAEEAQRTAALVVASCERGEL